MTAENIVELTNVSKAFPGVVALDQVDLQVRRGEVHGLVGENGAGKSTLISILNGVQRPDGGQIRVNGVACTIGSPSEAAALGMSFIHQEPTLFPDLSVVENIFPGSMLENRWGIIDKPEARRRTEKLLARLNLNIAPLSRVKDLRLAEAQMVEIMRAVSRSAQILVMDEPTSSLTDTEKQALFDLIASAEGRRRVDHLRLAFPRRGDGDLRSRHDHEGRQEGRHAHPCRIEQGRPHPADDRPRCQVR